VHPPFRSKNGRRYDQKVDIRSGKPARLQGALAGDLPHIGRELVIVEEVARLDPGPFYDPFIGRLYDG